MSSAPTQPNPLPASLVQRIRTLPGGGLTAALALTLKNVPTIAVVDICLPARNDGLTLIRRLTQDFEIPVMAISMAGGATRSALQAGAIRCLDKARVVDDLFDALHAISQCSEHRAHAVPPQCVSASRPASSAPTYTATTSPLAPRVSCVRTAVTTGRQGTRARRSPLSDRTRGRCTSWACPEAEKPARYAPSPGWPPIVRDRRHRLREDLRDPMQRVRSEHGFQFGP
jgi:CheY-like chemotaxis protein